MTGTGKEVRRSGWCWCGVHRIHVGGRCHKPFSVGDAHGLVPPDGSTQFLEGLDLVVNLVALDLGNGNEIAHFIVPLPNVLNRIKILGFKSFEDVCCDRLLHGGMPQIVVQEIRILGGGVNERESVRAIRTLQGSRAAGQGLDILSFCIIIIVDGIICLIF